MFKKNDSFVNQKNFSAIDVTNLLFYMYDLPQEYWWRWPRNTSDCVDSGYVSHNHSQLSGIGKLLDINSGLFFSWHGSIFSSVFNRLKRSKRRTRNPDEASLFIIPYGDNLNAALECIFLTWFISLMFLKISVSTVSFNVILARTGNPVRNRSSTISKQICLLQNTSQGMVAGITSCCGR